MNAATNTKAISPRFQEARPAPRPKAPKILTPAEREALLEKEEARRVTAAQYNPKEPHNTKREWVIEGLIALRSMAGWLGPEKAQKSVMAKRIAMHVACGKDLFGFRIRKARRVVYLDGENPSEEIDLRYKALLAHFTPEEHELIQKNLVIVKGRELLDQGVNLEVENPRFWKSVARVYPAEVYILDAFQMFHSKNEISNKEIKKVLLKLRSYCGPQNCLIILHHTRKREDREVSRKKPVRLREIGARVWSDKCLGAGVFKRLADVILCQEVAEERNRAGEVLDWTVDLAAFGRIIEDVPLLQFKDDGDYWHRLVRELSSSVQTSYNKLRNSRGPWSSKNAAAKDLELSRSQANIHINQLIQKEYLRIGDDGSVGLV